MTIVHQFNRFSCVAACFESFLRDLGRDFDHKKFVESNLDLFNGGSEIQGCCEKESIPLVAQRLGLHCLETDGTFSVQSPNDTVFLFIYWKGDEGQKHLVRLAAVNEDTLLVMNPNIRDSLDAIPERWIRGVFKISAISEPTATGA